MTATQAQGGKPQATILLDHGMTDTIGGVGDRRRSMLFGARC